MIGGMVICIMGVGGTEVGGTWVSGGIFVGTIIIGVFVGGTGVAVEGGRGVVVGMDVDVNVE